VIDIRDVAEASGKGADRSPTPTVWYVHKVYWVESVEDEEGLTLVRRLADGTEEHFGGLVGWRQHQDGTTEYVEGKQIVHYVTAVPLGLDTDVTRQAKSLPMTVGGSAGLPEDFGGSGGYAQVYSPLKYHDMFLEFAALAEEPITRSRRSGCRGNATPRSPRRYTRATEGRCGEPGA
jgi:hypothetical protein